MTSTRINQIDDIIASLDEIIAAPDATLVGAAQQLAGELLGRGETILEIWLSAHDVTPTKNKFEGFRLLALQRQGARRDTTFNACRETCRELVYHRNLVCGEPAHADTARRLRLGAMVVRHLALFIGGKLEVAGLGEFCCSSRPLRQHDAKTLAPPIP